MLSRIGSWSVKIRCGRTSAISWLNWTCGTARRRHCWPCSSIWYPSAKSSHIRAPTDDDQAFSQTQDGATTAQTQLISRTIPILPAPVCSYCVCSHANGDGTITRERLEILYARAGGRHGDYRRESGWPSPGQLSISPKQRSLPDRYVSGEPRRTLARGHG